MGRKQKMKKMAAAKAAAASALAAATAADTKVESKAATMQKLLSCLQQSEAAACCSKANCETASSSSSSSSSASEDDDDDKATAEAVTAKKEPQPNELLSFMKHSRGEKKARRLLMKLDLEPVQNVSRITMRKAKNVLLIIDQPEVYKCPNTKTLICFGEVRIEDTSNAATTQAAERFLNDINPSSTQSKYDAVSATASAGGNDDDEDAAAAVGSAAAAALDEKDIELVMMQAVCSRGKAIKALLRHNSDVVNAIMDLTIGC
ncbi:Nacalpha [Drosophila busckii]|uniref:Nacalpha n=1 Tax=Drosophila busckii TaxID=30019 RepID=A0A0M3QTE4_DROBS|nr:nascent polypeptide-associated complex subunit alpha [Drosophila busckii]ALC38739.1 Nacalpha [Drosophila busckii]